MPLAFLTLITGLTLSAVAIYYSVIGLTSIFAGAFWAIIIMGATLEVAKLVSAWWLKANWERAPKLMRSYMLIAVIVLMVITSMGIFGFLSKAHLDQNLVSGDVVDRVAIIDERIKTQKDNIEAARKALRQMDEAVDQTMSRSSDEKGADKAAALRRSQQRERTNLQNDIAKSQNEIAKLNEERAPIAKDLRAVEAEVGPIKYIAKLIYGDKTDQNLLEKAVTWVIMTIVFVFDPLAVLLMLASQMSFQWARENRESELKLFAQPREPKEKDLPEPEDTGYVPGPWPFTIRQPSEQDHIDEANAKLAETPVEPDVDSALASAEAVQQEEKSALEQWNSMIEEAEREAQEESSKAAKQKWKADNPHDTIKKYEKLQEKGIITDLPWDQITAEQVAKSYQKTLPLEDRPEGRIKPDLTEVIEPETPKKKITYIIKEKDQQIRREKNL